MYNKNCFAKCEMVFLFIDKIGGRLLNYTIINQILILMLMMVIGITLRKKNIITDEVNKGLSNILLCATLPCLIVNSFNIDFSMEMFKNAVTILICSICIHILLIIFSNIFYFRMTKDKKSIYKFATVFSNCGFIGYPIVQGIFGDIGVFYTSIYTIPFNIFMWSYGVMLFTGEKDLKTIKKNLINMPTLSIVVGVIVFIFSINIPPFILSTLQGVGSMTTPLSMFIIGSMLANVEIKKVFKGFEIYYMSFIKLILAPIFIAFVLKLFDINEVILQVCVIMVAMPTATLIGVLAEKYDINKEAASKSAFFTTVLSLLTIPLIMAIV